MQITNKELKKWKFLMEHGDFAAISQTIEKPDYRKISSAFKLKRCDEDIYKAIKAFYEARERRVYEQTEDDNN